MYAVPASYREASIFDTVPQSSIPCGVTFDQFLPPSRVTCTSPSFVPAQITPACLGDSASAKTTSIYSTPILSPVSPPENPCFDLSFLVRSGLITFQLLPPSVVMWTYWLPT